jgi:hypothetical protein
VIWFVAFLSSPYRETLKNAIKKIGKGGELDARPRKTFFITFLKSPYREALNQHNTGSRKKNSKTVNPGKKKNPRDFFWKRAQFVFLVFLNSPCRETPKNALKKKGEKRHVRTFFSELAQMYVGSSFFFPPPLEWQP